jgi:hypothetical protein
MRLYHYKIFYLLAGLPVFYSRSNESSLTSQFKWLDNTYKEKNIVRKERYAFCCPAEALSCNLLNQIIYLFSKHHYTARIKLHVPNLLTRGLLAFKSPQLLSRMT